MQHRHVNHAESTRARMADTNYPADDLWHCTRYTTVEPCCMCAGTAYCADIGRVVFGLTENMLLQATGNRCRKPDDERVLVLCVRPITGGEMEGAGWRGRVLPGGADFQLIVNDTLAELDARYVLEAEGGQRLYVQNLAVRSGPPELMARIARGEPVDPSEIYFRCMPRLETAWPEMAWINERLFVGTGARFPDHVLVSVFEML